jgi:mono/diheme cytochrome c family protein
VPTITSLVLTCLLGMSLALFAAYPAHAGGWAVTTLDPLPPISEGQTIDVGFTIRQHGVRPAILDSGVAIITIRVDDSTNKLTRFDAKPQGSPGHYVAQVRFPTAGTFEWSVDQGWFASQELGTITIGAAPAESPPDTRSPIYPVYIRFGLAAAAIVLGGLLLGRAISRRAGRIDSHTVPVKVGTLAFVGLTGLAFASWQMRSEEGFNIASPSVQTGGDLFQSKGCAACHSGPDSQPQFVQFPPLQNANLWAHTRRPGMSSSAYLTESLKAPDIFQSPLFQPNGPTMGMPQLNLTDQEIAVLVDYLLQS